VFLQTVLQDARFDHQDIKQHSEHGESLKLSAVNFVAQREGFHKDEHFCVEPMFTRHYDCVKITGMSF
jgi:hypothetical protein